MIYAVVDTNILVSALFDKSDKAPSVQIAQRIYTGRIIPLYSKDIISEYHEVLRRERFHFDENVVDIMLTAIEQHGILVKPEETGEVLPDAKDLPFYEVATEMQNNGAYLITGNIKHYPKKAYIVTPRQMLDILTTYN